MANKLYEENSIIAIAEKIRQFSFNKSKTFTVSQMPDGIESACQDNYEKGQDSGFIAGELSGAEKVKTEEARTVQDSIYDYDSLTITVPKGYYANTEDLVVDTFYDKGVDDVKQGEARTGADVSTIVEVPNRSVEVSVTGGYYANETVVNVDVQNVYTDGFTKGSKQGYDYGYEDGLAAGGTADHTLEDALISGGRIEEYYNDRIFSVRPYAFAKCTELFAANLPNCVSIGTSSFYACSALSTVTLGPGGYESDGDGLIGTGAFAGCVELRELILRYPWVVINIGSGVFANTPLQTGSGCIYVEDDLVDIYVARDEWSNYNIKSILERE